MVKVKQDKDFYIIGIENDNIKVELLNYGASIKSIKTKDYLGNFEDIVLEYKNLDDYLENNIHLNATIGPIAGRVKDGLIKMSDEIYQLDKNFNEKHTLHGGTLALSHKFFDFEITENKDFTEVLFYYETDEPFNYLLRVIYQINDNKIRIDYEIETDKEFIFNLTNHAYFNLSGNLKADVLNHQIFLASNLRHELDEDSLFTGKIIKEKTIYDFTELDYAKKAINPLSKTSKGGLDDIYYFPNNDLRKLMAVITDPISKRVLKIRSTMDHLVLYSHNNINQLPLVHLNDHKKHYALCFECEKAPYGFNDKDARSLLVKPGKISKNTIIFEFLTQK
ncbi:MAG: hypothetical protein RBR66_02340 [Candidatus Izemoplasmatales bacterium]|jgi:aldose 1-epimerase|nr:hypothetical protein [Candidatus Izemoplasmatales bacterium]